MAFAFGFLIVVGLRCMHKLHNVSKCNLNGLRTPRPSPCAKRSPYHPARQRGHCPLHPSVRPEDRAAFACWQMDVPRQASLGIPPKPRSLPVDGQMGTSLCSLYIVQVWVDFRENGVLLRLNDVVRSWLRLLTPIDCTYWMNTKYFRSLRCCGWAHGCTPNPTPNPIHC